MSRNNLIGFAYCKENINILIHHSLLKQQNSNVNIYLHYIFLVFFLFFVVNIQMSQTLLTLNLIRCQQIRANFREVPNKPLTLSTVVYCCRSTVHVNKYCIFFLIAHPVLIEGNLQYPSQGLNSQYLCQIFVNKFFNPVGHCPVGTILNMAKDDMTPEIANIRNISKSKSENGLHQFDM